jgi:CDP-glucose 4,6-dehydratase
MPGETWAGAFRNRRVLVTGHTGFKGGWLSVWLGALGAEVTGYALPPQTEPNIFDAARVGELVRHAEGDVRDARRLGEVWREARPEIVFHLAAQPLVRESYRAPLATLETNFNGTAHVLELARLASDPLALVVVTSDKCYENREWVYGYREGDAMGGHDVYSMSKGATELLVSSYRRSFFQDGATRRVACATARAGNVVGGGDWSADRIVPDCVRAAVAGGAIDVRNPRAVRPWQHVLEPLSGYLELGARLLAADEARRLQFCEAWNFGPEVGNTRTVGELVETFVARWGAASSWRDASDPDAPHEASLLRLSIDKAYARLGWSPRWGFDETVARTVEWYKAFYAGGDVRALCRRQIADYSGGALEEDS